MIPHIPTSHSRFSLINSFDKARDTKFACKSHKQGGRGEEEREIDSLRSNAKGARGVVLNGYVEDVTSGAKLSISSIYRGGGGRVKFTVNTQSIISALRLSSFNDGNFIA